MLNPILLKEICHYLLTDKQALNKFGSKLNKEFFEACPALEVVVGLSVKRYAATGLVLSSGELINALVEASRSNKVIKNLIDDPYELVNDIMKHGRYDSESIPSTILNELEYSKVIEATNKIVGSLNTEQTLKADDVADIFSRISSELKEIEFVCGKNELDIDFDDLMGSFEDSKDQSDIIQTGFPIMDSHQLGLTRSGEIGIIVAPPNRGKTALMVALARNLVMKGYNVLFVTGETHVRDLKKRFWSGVLNTSINSLASANRETALKAYTGAKRIGGSIQWHSFIDQTSFTPDDLEFVIQKHNEMDTRTIDVIVLDYFDLMLPNQTKGGDRDNFRVQINKIYKSVRRISAKYGIPIWTASQTNRDGEDTILITNKNIGEDWQKVCNADKIISFNQTMVEVENRVARLFILKTRNSTGKNMVIQVRTQFDQMKFKEIQEISFKDHQKLMATLEHENRRTKSDKKNVRRPNRLG